MAINEKQESNDIAIIGLGFRLPNGEKDSCNDSPNKLWHSLINGFNGIVKTTERWSDNFSKLGEITNGYAGLLPFDELKSFDPLFFGISPSEASTIDPQQRLILKCTWEAFEDAGIDPIKLRSSNTSVFIGCSTSEYRESNVNQNEQYINLFGTYAHSIPNRISYCFDFHGESMAVDSACSSSGVAITLGSQSILSGKSELSIVGGVNLLIDTNNIKAFSYLNMLSKTGVCRPFDKDANGLLRGEVVGIAILKKLSNAIKDGDKIYCVLKGGCSNVDGNGYKDKSNFYAPSSSSQANNIKNALKISNLKPNDIDFFECHGTGTPTGDPIETKSLSLAFSDGTRSKENPLLIGSIKSNIGHSEAASGIASLIKCCLILKNKYFVPNINYSTPNPMIKFDEWNLKVITEPIPFSKLNNNNRPISIAINNFGVTGSNCCLVLSEFKHSTLEKYINIINNKNKEYLIPFSANSTKSLEDYQQLLLSNDMDVEFTNFVQNQILKKSKSLIQRSVIIASDWDQFKSKKPSFYIKTSNSKSANISIQKKKPITVFVFAGQGSQYNTMALELYNNEPIFRQSMDLLNDGLSKYYGYSVIDKLRESDTKSIHEPTIAQPSVCMLNISLFKLYKHWGIESSFIVGHSLGEIAASYCSGMITLDTLCYLIYHRSIAQNKTHGNGRMLSINIDESQFKSIYSSNYPDIEIACFNSPTSIVVAGNEDKLNEIASDLNKKGEFCSILGSQSSFHTSNQSVTKDYLLPLVIESKEANIPTFSTVTTNLFYFKTNPFNSQYVYDNIINPVRFSETISNLYKHIESNQLGSEIVFIEIAAHPTLQFYIKQMIPKSNGDGSNEFKVSVYSPLHKKKNDVKEIQKTISQLYCDNGYDIDFLSQFNDKDNQTLNNINLNECQLPNYQWEDQKYWKVDIVHGNHYNNGPAIDILGNINYNSINIKSYETYIDIKRKPFQYLKGHIVKGKYYFPGTGYLDNLLKIYPDQDLTVVYFEFVASLVFTEGVNQCLQTNVCQTSSNEYKLDFHYKDQKTNEWVQSSIGTFQLSNFGTELEKLNIVNIIERECNLTCIKSGDELYSLIKQKTGLQYKGAFKGVKKCYLGNNCSLSEVSLEIPIDLSDQNSFFSSSVLDVCFHGLLILVEDQSQIVFHKLEGLKYYSSNVPKDRNQFSFIYVHTVLCESQDVNSYSASFTITLPDGTILIEIEKATIKSLIPIKDSLKIEYPSNELFSTYLQPLDSEIDLVRYGNSIEKAFNSFDKVIVFCDDLENSNVFNKSLKDRSINKEVIEISTINQFKKLIETSKITDQSLIYFTKSIDQLDIDNFKLITLEYIQINQQLLSNSLKCKHVLITLNSTCENYLSASILGSKRYFEEHNQLELFAIDFDQVSIENDKSNLIILELINQDKYKQKEFIIRENKVYYEKVKKETDLKKKFKSNSFEDNQSLMAKLSPNFDYQLDSKPNKLNNDEVLIKVQAFGLNYFKDNTIGEFSGVIEKVGSIDLEYKIGDEVYGIGYNTTSSHIVANSNWIFKKPNNINHIEASSMPLSYLESLYSLYTIGRLNENESVLIHSGSLSALNILKWKGHKSNVFVTVDSEEKKQYIKEIYGNFVTAIYSSKNKEFVQQIKLKLKESGSNKSGVDLVLNTLPSDFIDSNFKCLNKNGRFIELSTNKMMENEYIFKSIHKFNISYHFVDIVSMDQILVKDLLLQISKGVEMGKLQILPTSDYSHLSTNDALDILKSGKEPIRTIVVENNTDILGDLIKKHSEQSNYSILKSDYQIQESCLGRNLLITGQSGIVLEILKWIVKFSKNVDNVIILSKSSMKWELEYLINKNKQIKFHFKSIDISKKESVEKAIDQILNDNPSINNIDSIFHYAFKQVTSDVMNINLNQLNESHDAKTFGAINLHNESIRRNWKLLNFVMASSTVTLAGSPQQCTYVSACSVLDSLSRYRKSIGLPSICSYYGSIKSGLVLRNESIAVALEGQGYNIVSMNKVLGALDIQIQNQKHSTNLIVSGFNFNLFKNNPQHSISIKFEDLINEAVSNQSNKSDGIKGGEKSLDQLIISMISELLSIEEIKLNLDIGLVDYGADSLLNGQLKNWIEKEIGPNLVTTQQLQSNTINSLVQHIKKNFERLKK
ncbi:hypothetical protein ACTA71_002701 [Dictyostelium dimigraforme]